MSLKLCNTTDYPLPVQLEGECWRCAYDCKPNPRWQSYAHEDVGALIVALHRTQRDIEVDVMETGKVQIINGKWFKLRVKIAPRGDGEFNSESFAGWAFYRDPPFSYDDEGRIVLKRPTCKCSECGENMKKSFPNNTTCASCAYELNSAMGDATP